MSTQPDRTPTTRTPTRQMQIRARVVLILVAVIFFMANVVKLFQLQIIQGEDWQKRAVSQQLSDTVVSAKRGPIYDADMELLAVSADVWKIIMSPKNIPACNWKRLEGVDKEAEISKEEGVLMLRKRIATDLSEMFNLEYDKLYEQTGKVNSQYVVIQSKVEYKEKEAFVDWAETNGLNQAFYIITDYKRYYPESSLASTILGFTGTDNVGLEGLEAKYNSVLSGTPGRIVTAQNGVGDEMPTTMEYTKVVDAVDGYGLVTTIDSFVQAQTEKHLAEAVSATGSLHRGVAIVMDVNTGGILAMATKGDYDPNDPFTIADPSSKALIATLTGDEKSEAIYAARQLQWRNKAITDSYEPGSVFKVFTTAMGLEENMISESTCYTCTNSLLVSGWPQPIRCHTYPRAHGSLDLPAAISNSCNPYFMQLVLKLGANTFFKYFNGFGFTEKTGIDMNGEQDYRIFHSLETLQNSEASLATASFGQTFQVTPIQMITAMCAIANGGKLMTPYVVAQVLDADGNVISTTEPKVKRQIISEETSERICKILGDIVNGGGSKNAYVAGYRVAGKTGTSEKRATVENTDDVIASFSGFAPADNPQVAVLVLLDDPQTDIRFRYGSTLSAPVAQKIFEAIMPHLGIEPSYTNEELSTLSRTTPSVAGQTISVAQTKMSNAGLKATIVGNGEKVVRQVPEAGQTIPAGGTVLLYTEEEDVAMVTVPDLTGLSVTEVNARAARLGLNVQMTGLVGGSSNAALSNKQSYPAGAEVPKGTVIEVNFYYQDTSEN